MYVRNEKVYKPRRRFDNRSYKSLYRFNEENVVLLADYFLGEDEETRGGALTVKQQMEVFLRYVGDPGFQNGVAEDIGIHQSTVSKTITNVSQKIFDKSHYWIKFPSLPNEIMEAKREWQLRYNFPSAVGAIDCTHILINKPHEHGDEYVNRKGLTTLNVQATCNAEEKFTSIDASWPGSVHDSRIFRNCNLNQILARYGDQAILLGDKGYGITPWLMIPFRNPGTPQQHNYNRVHAQNRVIIERCFGQLKRRFPILMNRVRLQLNKIPKIIICCAVLHNFAKHINDNINDLDDIPQEPEHNYNNNNQNNEPHEAEIRRLGIRRRNEIANILFAVAVQE